MYLESIFIGGDIRSQLPEEAKKFDNIDKVFKRASAKGLGRHALPHGVPSALASGRALSLRVTSICPVHTLCELWLLACGSSEDLLVFIVKVTLALKKQTGKCRKDASSTVLPRVPSPEHGHFYVRFKNIFYVGRHREPLQVTFCVTLCHSLGHIIRRHVFHTTKLRKCVNAFSTGIL